MSEGGDVKSAAIPDGEELIIHTEEDVCARCPDNSVGVAATENRAGDTLCMPLCDDCKSELEQDEEAMEFEFIKYE